VIEPAVVAESPAAVEPDAQEVVVIEEVPVAGDEITDMDDLLALLEVQVEKKAAKSLDDAILDFFAIK
jgi:hypothetical protein